MLYPVLDADASLHSIANAHDVSVVLMASAGVPIEAKAIAQAMRLTALAPLLAGRDGGLDRVVLTPDLHVGPDVPVGVAFDTRRAVVPGVIGNDIGCGMRLAVFDDVGELDERTLEALEARLRGVFFHGQRDLALRPADRLAVLEHGLLGLLDAPHVNAGEGHWAELVDGLVFHVERTHRSGALDSGGVDPTMSAWATGSGERDSQLGSLGGGNHFCEIGRVAELADGPTAWDWGLRPGALTVMVHAGSLGFGHVAGGAARRAARSARISGDQLPDALLPLFPGAAQDGFVRAMRNAANLAFVNRLALTAMAAGALTDVLGARHRWVSVGDAPHNLIWSDGAGGFRHRKGACPADGPGEPGAFVYTGQPVLIPGSMGDSSWVLAGAGADETLASTCHGAGRVLSRGDASRTRDDTADTVLRVVTPVDPVAVAAQGRRDLLAEHARRVREEAPRAYKPVGPVVDAVVAAGAARKVARLEPLLTVKG